MGKGPKRAFFVGRLSFSWRILIGGFTVHTYIHNTDIIVPVIIFAMPSGTNDGENFPDDVLLDIFDRIQAVSVSTLLVLLQISFNDIHDHWYSLHVFIQCICN